MPILHRAHQGPLQLTAKRWEDQLPSLHLNLKKRKKPRGEFMKLSERQDTFEPHESMYILKTQFQFNLETIGNV